MYSRQRGEQTYTFEASGGLLNAGLVMRDRETDSYWSIITENAIYGAAAGQRLEQVPGSTKTTWGEWKALHPTTRALSVDGVEHRAESPYDKYFSSADGFRNLSSSDRRLPDKELIYGFHWQGKAYAVPHREFRRGGAGVRLGDRELFVYRRQDDSFYRSTAALLAASGARFAVAAGGWQLSGEDGVAQPWDAAARAFMDAGAVAESFTGFDTYWYIWSLTNPGTEILRAE